MIRAIERWRIAGALALACLAAPAVAGAQDAAATSAISDPREAARTLYREGLKLAEQAEWAEAYGRFVRAQELYPAPTNLFNIGQCQRALGRYVGALDTFKRYLAEASGAESADARKTAEGYVEELAGRVARVDVRVEPKDASLAIDGKRAAGEQVLDPGRHTVRVERAGYTTAFVDRDLKPGERAVIDVKLERLPAHLTVKASVAGANVLVDGASVGAAPWAGERPGGSHKVEIRAAGYEPYESVLRVSSGEKGELNAKLVVEKVSVTRRWWFWSLVGGVVASAAVTTFVATRDVPPEEYKGGSLDWVVKR